MCVEFLVRVLGGLKIDECPKGSIKHCQNFYFSYLRFVEKHLSLICNHVENFSFHGQFFELTILICEGIE